MQKNKIRKTGENAVFGKKLTNAFSEAKELLLKANFRDRYFEALRDAQLFEVLLDTLCKSLVSLGSSYFKSIGLSYDPWGKDTLTIKDYLNRLRTFFPEKEYQGEYKILRTAMEARNSFIHGSFKDKRGDFFAVNLDKEEIHLNPNAKVKLEEWSEAYGSAYPIVIKWMLKVAKIKQ